MTPITLHRAGRWAGLATIAALLSGCAAFQLSHPTKPPEALAQDRYDCAQEAAKAFPPQIVRVPTLGYGAFNYSYGPSFRHPHSPFISPFGDPFGPQIFQTPVDANRNARDDMEEKCLAAKGWVRGIQ